MPTKVFLCLAFVSVYQCRWVLLEGHLVVSKIIVDDAEFVESLSIVIL